MNKYNDDRMTEVAVELQKFVQMRQELENQKKKTAGMIEDCRRNGVYCKENAEFLMSLMD